MRFLVGNLLYPIPLLKGFVFYFETYLCEFLSDFNAYTLYFFCILLLLFENFKIEVGQLLHFVCFPATFLKLVIFSKLSFEKSLGNRQSEVDQLQFNIFWKIGAKCNKSTVYALKAEDKKMKTLLRVELEGKIDKKIFLGLKNVFLCCFFFGNFKTGFFFFILGFPSKQIFFCHWNAPLFSGKHLRSIEST